MSNKANIHPVVELSIDELVPLSNNPFELYEGQRLERSKDKLTKFM